MTVYAAYWLYENGITTECNDGLPDALTSEVCDRVIANMEPEEEGLVA